MEDFLASQNFKTYALCSALLLGKMMVLSIMTSRQRIKHGKFSNKEDAVAAGLKASNQYDLKVSYHNALLYSLASVLFIFKYFISIFIKLFLVINVQIFFSFPTHDTKWRSRVCTFKAC